MGLGIALFIAFIALWQAVAAAGWLSDIAPTPAHTWDRAVEILSDPFYRDGPASVGILWHMVASLRRVLIGFAIAMVIAIPLGFWLGSSTTFRRASPPAGSSRASWGRVSTSSSSSSCSIACMRARSTATRSGLSNPATAFSRRTFV